MMISIVYSVPFYQNNSWQIFPRKADVQILRSFLSFRLQVNCRVFLPICNFSPGKLRLNHAQVQFLFTQSLYVKCVGFCVIKNFCNIYILQLTVWTRTATWKLSAELKIIMTSHLSKFTQHPHPPNPLSPIPCFSWCSFKKYLGQKWWFETVF